MKLKSMHINNFRQFYGEQHLAFGVDPSANVTVVHGENGSGKTALLNAFKWAFYGTTDFETGIEHLVCERSVAEANADARIEMSVSIEFEHEKNDYRLIRSVDFRVDSDKTCTNTGKSLLKLDYIAPDGANRDIQNPQSHINQIFPERMHPYFFFNGERIEKLASIDSSNDIRNAIKAIMGLEILERAKLHVGQGVLKSLRSETKKHSDKAMAAVIEKEEFVLEELSKLRNAIEDCETTLKHTELHLKEVNKKLREIEPIAELQQERTRIEHELIELSEKSRSLRQERLEFISTKALLAFFDAMGNTAQELLNEQRRQGELPSKIKSQFIDDLLSNGQCICGRELPADSPAANEVKKFRNRNAGSDVEDAFIFVNGAIASAKKSYESFKERFLLYSEQFHEMERKRTRLIQQRDEISHKIGTVDIENVHDLELKRAELQGKIQSYNREIGANKQKTNDINKEYASLRSERAALEAKTEAAAASKRKLSLAEETLTVLEALYESLSDTVRRELSAKVDDTFKSIMKKDYWAEIADDYTLRIKKRINGTDHDVIDKSTGESQVSSLSFIGGLVALAKKRYMRSDTYFRGGIFPIVMDSPYGNLDPEYRHKVAEAIPGLADQVVIFVSNSQWRGEVAKAVDGRIGREYTLMYHTPHIASSVKTASVIPQATAEYSEIREGYYE